MSRQRTLKGRAPWPMEGEDDPFDGGWIKLHRKLLTNGWLRNPKLFTFWIYCLLRATHKPTKVIHGFKEIHLQPGEFIFGRREAAKEIGLSERQIRTCIKFLKNAQNLTIQSTNRFSIISIINWDTYQKPEIKNDQPNDQQVTSKRPASDQQVTTDKNDKNDKNEKNKDTHPSDSSFKKAWNLYPNKAHIGDAEKAWRRLNPDPNLVEKIIKAIEQRKNTEAWKAENGRYVPHLDHWLNARGWEDETKELTWKEMIDLIK